MVDSNRTLSNLHSIAYGGVKGDFVYFWNNGEDDVVEETSHTHFYSTDNVMPGVYRFSVRYGGKTKEITVQPCQEWQADTRYYIDFEEPQPEPVADSCISVNGKVEGISVLIEVDNA